MSAEQAWLLTQQGMTADAIAAALGASVAQVEQWLDEARTWLATQPPWVPPPDEAPSLQDLRLRGDFISVERAEDGVGFLVLFDDDAARIDDLMERSVKIVQGFPGVQAAHREDRELIVAVGTFVPEDLRDHVVNWWLEQARR